MSYIARIAALFGVMSVMAQGKSALIAYVYIIACNFCTLEVFLVNKFIYLPYGYFVSEQH